MKYLIKEKSDISKAMHDIAEEYEIDLETDELEDPEEYPVILVLYVVSKRFQRFAEIYYEFIYRKDFAVDNKQTYPLFAGLLGRYSDTTIKGKLFNEIIDEYNENVNTFEGIEAQMQYQMKMLRKIAIISKT